jgi:hypothetical protein
MESSIASAREWQKHCWMWKVRRTLKLYLTQSQRAMQKVSVKKARAGTQAKTLLLPSTSQRDRDRL